jgi:quinol-cytochrome oxidoreductase complex cytochrome b subunit
MGLRAALTETADDIVERTLTGIDTAELRAMLRGEAPGRPNPRLRPHADSFWVHIRPGYYNRAITGVYPTFRLGWLSTYFFFFELITGIFLMVFYTPSADAAYSSMLNILSNVPFGEFMRDLHRLGAEAMVLIVALHMLRTFLTASYKKPRQFTWVTGMFLLLFTMGLSFTGYLLPWDQLAYWAVTIGASMAEATPPPFVGAFVNVLIKGSANLGGAGLLRFYLLHVLIFPGLLLAALGMHYYKVVLHGESLPPELEKTGEDTGKRVPVSERVYFLPDVLASEIYMIALTTMVMVVAVTFFYNAPLENHANPLSTPLHTEAPWYFLWIQGLLKLGDKTLMGVILPGVLFGAFTLMPYFDVGPVRHWGKRRMAISSSLIFMYLMSVFSWMGTPLFLVQTTMDQEIFHELAPTEKIGYAREVAYEDYQALIPMGTIAMQETDELFARGEDDEPYALWTEINTEDKPALAHMLEEYEHLVHEAGELDPDLGGLPGVEGYFYVEQIQADVVGVTLLLEWIDPETNQPNTADLYVPLHQDAYPELLGE